MKKLYVSLVRHNPKLMEYLFGFKMLLFISVGVLGGAIVGLFLFTLICSI